MKRKTSDSYKNVGKENFTCCFKGSCTWIIINCSNGGFFVATSRSELLTFRRSLLSDGSVPKYWKGMCASKEAEHFSAVKSAYFNPTTANMPQMFSHSSRRLLYVRLPACLCVTWLSTSGCPRTMFLWGGVNKYHYSEFKLHTWKNVSPSMGVVCFAKDNYISTPSLYKW